MDKCRFLLVDAFTDTPFNGAQIAVFPEATALQTAQMLTLARELNCSETVFIHSAEDCLGELKVYSPRGECGIGSHTTVAAASALVHDGLINVDSAAQYRFKQGKQFLDIDLKNTSAGVQTQLSWSVHAQIDRYVPRSEELQHILELGGQDIETLKSLALFVSCDLPYLIVPLRSLEAVYRARFNAEAWAQSSASSVPVGNILVYCRETENTQADFHLRLLGPYISQQDDPPVGASVPAFAAFLREAQSLAEGRHTLYLERGRQSLRQSLLMVEFFHSETAAMSISVGGNAVVVAEGKILRP